MQNMHNFLFDTLPHLIPMYSSNLWFNSECKYECYLIIIVTAHNYERAVFYFAFNSYLKFAFSCVLNVYVKVFNCLKTCFFFLEKKWLNRWKVMLFFGLHLLFVVSFLMTIFLFFFFFFFFSFSFSKNKNINELFIQI
jgi:hypothetical protein